MFSTPSSKLSDLRSKFISVQRHSYSSRTAHYPRKYLAVMAIQTSLHPLNHADGSAAYNSPNGYSILAAVNGPVEVQRRDELPDEAHIEVNVRPHDGVGQVKERHLELLIANTLHDVIYTEMFPRQMVQLTLQILKVPTDDDAIGRTNPQAESVCLPI
jgi:ribonuclease PH